MGQKIREARVALGWSQSDVVARMTELLTTAEPDSPYYGATGYSSYSALSKVESGKSAAPNGRNLLLLAAALNQQPENLLPENYNLLESQQFLVDLPYIDLPIVSVAARASFAPMCGSESDHGPEDTLRLYLSSTTDRMNYDKARVFTSKGDSMEGIIDDGARVIARLVPKAKWELLHNKVCVVGYGDVVTIKQVFENNLHEDFLTLYPAKPSLAPLRVPRNLITCIWEVFEFFDRPTVQVKRA